MNAFARWSPAIFWCLAAGSFCLLLERGADLDKLAIGIGLSVIAGWLPILAVPFSIAGALVAGWGLYEAHPALASIALLWAASAVPLARMRAGAPLRTRAPAELVTCFGAGYTPKGSGTVGAVTAIPIGWLLSQLDLSLRLGLIGVFALVAVAISYWYMAGREGDLDPKEVVLDEHVGVLIAFAAVPWEWAWVLAAFVLFRLFDILKPWPVGFIDRTVKNPAGVMLDDYAAGVLAALVSIGIRYALELG